MRIQGLDLLRGIAIALVMLRHAFPEPFQGAGVVGVVMFFTLSGYLITGVLTRKPTLKEFYARRARRLVPAMLVVVAAIALVTLTINPLDDRKDLPRTTAVALTWTGNLPFDHGSNVTFHLWTLATEEQFYLVWPALVGLAFARGRVKEALMGTAAACLIACVATLFWLTPDYDLAYTLPTSWAICFVIGAAARLLGETTRIPTAAVPVALAGLAVLSVIPLRGHPLTYLAGGPAIAGLTVILLLAWRNWAVVRPPALRALELLGTVSYGAYLWNYPLTLWLRPIEWGGPLAALLTVAAAVLSWKYVEQPVLRPRRELVVAA